MSCPAGTELVDDVTVDDVDTLSYGYHIIIFVFLIIDLVTIAVYLCSKGSPSTEDGRRRRRNGIRVRITFFVILAVVLFCTCS